MRTMTDQFRTPLNWDDLRFVLALSRHGSLSATARVLRVNHATVSRRIDAVEGALGRPLFDRRPDGYQTTADGNVVIEQAKVMEAAALALSDGLVAASGPTGIVRVTLTRSLADLIVAEALGDLHAAAPGITVELLTEMRVLSVAQREADIALRLGRPKDSELVGRKISEVSYGYYASRPTIARWRKGEPTPLIAYDGESSFTAEAAWLDRHFPRQPVSFRSNSNLSQAAAARAGFGVALLPRYLGDSFKGIHALEFGPPMPTRELWLLVRRDLARLDHIRKVFDFLAANFAANKTSI